MNAVLRTHGLGVAYGPRTLFTGLDLTVADGAVIGLVGANGAGKSTLLRLLAGLRPEGAEVIGEIRLTPADGTVGYLAQEPEPRPGETVAQYIGRRTGVTAAEARMNAAAEALATDPDAPYSAALERWLGLGGADLAERIEQILADLGLDAHPDAAMTELSGGQAARAGLASVLAARFDVLLLDEPTNDLDLTGLDRLERFVTEARTPIVVVSHDREFLARTVSTVVELDLHQQRIAVYGGGYESYLTEREVARRHARERYEEYADTLGGLRARAQMQHNWLEHGVRNNRRKAAGKNSDNDKRGRAMRAESTEKQAAKARQTQRAIERLEVVEEPRKEWELRMSIAAAPRSGTVVATVDGARIEFPGAVIGPISASIDYGDRILLTGPNGAGKSTLLALLLGRLTPDTGTASLGSGVLVGEIDQARERFTGPGTLLDGFRAALAAPTNAGDPPGPDPEPAEVRTLLAKFGLRGDTALRPADSLSPGERTRAGLALLQARGVNLLVLDEPTNHLDLPAIEQLEQALESFDGTVVLVTHDRRMLDTVRATRRWRMDGGLLTEA